MEETVGFLLNDTARLYRRAFNARVKDEGFTALQWRLMHHLRLTPAIRQGPLAELIEVEPITLSRMIDRLEDSGFVERRADPQDRRAWQLFLTDKAQQLLKKMRPISEELNEAAVSGLSAEDREMLVRLARRVHQNLSQRNGKPE